MRLFRTNFRGGEAKMEEESAVDFEEVEDVSVPFFVLLVLFLLFGLALVLAVLGLDLVLGFSSFLVFGVVVLVDGFGVLLGSASAVVAVPVVVALDDEVGLAVLVVVVLVVVVES